MLMVSSDNRKIQMNFIARSRSPRSEVGDGASKGNSKSLQDEVYVDVDVRRVSDVDVDGSVFGLFLQENVSQFR